MGQKQGSDDRRDTFDEAWPAGGLSIGKRLIVLTLYLRNNLPSYHSLSLEKRVTNSPHRRSYLKKLWVFLHPRVGTLLLIFPIHGWWSLVSFESHQISYSSLWKVATATFQWQDSQIPPPSNQGALWLDQSASALALFLEKVLEPTVILDGLPLCKVRPKLLPSRKETAIAEVSRERAPHWEYSKGHQLGLHSTDGEP